MRTVVALLLAALPALALANNSPYGPGRATAAGSLAETRCLDSGYCYTQRPAMLGKKTKAFVVLGDSFSDVANAWEASKHTFPEPTHGYWQGRFLNGYGWSEYVQNMTGAVLINTANAGSTAAAPELVNGQPNSGISFPIPDLNAQTEMLLKVYKNSLKMRSTTFLWAGTADISYLIMSVLNLTGPNTTTAGVIDPPTAMQKVLEVPKAIIAAADKLLKAGFTKKIMIATIQPIEIQPIWNYGIQMMPAEFQAGAFSLIQGLTQTANAGIWAQAGELAKKYPGASIEVLDLYSYYYQLKSTALLYNLTMTNVSCVVSAPVPVLPTDLTATEIASTCTNPDNYMFWDSSHPSRVTHGLLGRHITEVLKVSGF